MTGIRYAALSLMLVLGISGFAPAFAGDGDGILTKKSTHSVAETADRLESMLKEKGLTIFARIDHAAGAKSAGLDLRPTTLLIFGNPKLGTPLMQAEQTVGLDLPQKALIYETADGEVFLSYNDPAYLLRRHGVTGKDGLAEKIGTALNAFSDGATGE